LQDVYRDIIEHALEIDEKIAEKAETSENV
jgi:hypothetical protein